MASINRKKVSQQMHSTNALNYGHLGTASFNEDARRWTFLRQPLDQEHLRSAFPFSLVKEEEVHAATGNFGSSDGDTRPESHISYRHLRARSANAALATVSVEDEEPISHAITKLAERHNPNLSDCLAFGSASLLLENDVRSGYTTVPIVAFASGSTGELITFVQLGRDTANVEDLDGKEVDLKIPTITTTNETSWKGSGETIQQICFAATRGYQSTWMAARLLSSTTIFHPLFHRKATQSTISGSNISPTGNSPSPLDANPILTIPTSRTGGHPHADVCFHPEDSQSLGVVDQHGNWSTWRIEGKRSVSSRVLFRIHLLKAGKLYSWENLRRPADIPPYHDGWHRISWLANKARDIDKVFVVNRRDASLHAIANEQRDAVDLLLGQINEARWVLDLRKSITHPGRLFILTTTRVLWISMADEARRDTSHSGEFTILCSWQHHRDGEDVTLHLTVLETSQCMNTMLQSLCRAQY